MEQMDRRSRERKKACLHAFAADLKDTFDVKCVVRDVSGRGCRLVSSRLHELPEWVRLFPEGFDQPLTGKIVWRQANVAGVSFAEAQDEASTPGAASGSAEAASADASGPRFLGYRDRLQRYRSMKG